LYEYSEKLSEIKPLKVFTVAMNDQTDVYLHDISVFKRYGLKNT